MPIPCTVVALHVSGVENTVADASSRFVLRTENRDPCPGRQLREKFRNMVVNKCVGLRGDPWTREFRSPCSSAFEVGLPEGRLWRILPLDLTGLALGRIVNCRTQGWSGSALCLALEPVEARSSKFRSFLECFPSPKRCGALCGQMARRSVLRSSGSAGRLDGDQVR